VVKQQAFVFGSDRWRIFVVKQLTVGSTWWHDAVSLFCVPTFTDSWYCKVTVDFKRWASGVYTFFHSNIEIVFWTGSVQNLHKLQWWERGGGLKAVATSRALNIPNISINSGDIINQTNVTVQRSVLGNLIVSSDSKEIFTFYGARRFANAATSARHWALSRATWV
jgi:hypothetical protein